MRRISLSVLTVFITLDAFGGARLPVVNIAAGSVSARAAFGDAPVIDTKNAASEPAVAAVKDAATAKDESAPQRKLVARSAKKSAAVAPKKEVRPVTDGEQILAANDVLSPRRPSSDLWAKSDMPLRMPSPDEFSVFRADYDLPEENLDSAFAFTAPRDITPRAATKTQTASVTRAAEPMSELDSQIAKLVELQRRADESVTAPAVAPRVASVSPRPTVAAPVPEKTNVAPAVTESAPDVKLSRMVVPMEMASDVVVRAVEKNTSPRIAAVRDDMTKMSPTELRKAFRKTFLSENKHLSTYQIDDRFDVASDMSASIEGFTAKRDLSESAGIRPLEIKIRFRDDDSALSRDNYNLLTEYASIVVSNPKRAIQVAIPQNATLKSDDRKLAARRLAIVEQVLRDTGVSEQRIMPVLSQRDEEGFVLRIISNDQYETLTKKQRDMFGDTISKKSYKSMSW